MIFDRLRMNYIISADEKLNSVYMGHYAIEGKSPMLF